MTDKMVDRITRSFESQSMMRTLGAKIHKIEKGKVIIEAPILPSTLQQQGYGHAGLTFSIGDSAAGYSALTLLPEGQEVMTAEIKINLLAPADGELLRAEGKVVKSGKRLVVVTSEINALKDGKTKLIAIIQATMVPVPLKP
ncbi:MAG: PaaI family thioesterase [SAR324 cluster bacterium]|nr:PaaI family thioesterase [SAR324 cluster bacterium]